MLKSINNFIHQNYKVRHHDFVNILLKYVKKHLKKSMLRIFEQYEAKKYQFNYCIDDNCLGWGNVYAMVFFPAILPITI